MAGTKEGGKKASATNKARHGDDFYRKIASAGREQWLQVPMEERKPWGFRANKDLARRAGKIGGSRTRKK